MCHITEYDFTAKSKHSVNTEKYISVQNIINMYYYKELTLNKISITKFQHVVLTQTQCNKMLTSELAQSANVYLFFSANAHNADK